MNCSEPFHEDDDDDDDDVDAVVDVTVVDVVSYTSYMFQDKVLSWETAGWSDTGTG